MNPIVYCYHCLVTSKKYIGQTRHPEVRKSRHKYNSKHYSCHSHFYNAVSKYGWDAFVYGVIEETTLSELDAREAFWIAFYDTFNNGYNSTTGGEKYNVSEETRRKCREANIGRKHSAKTKAYMSSIRKGMKHSDMTKAKMSSRRKGRVISSKYCYSITCPDGSVVETTSLKQFARDRGLNRKCLDNCGRGKAKQHQGFTVLRSLRA